MDSHNLFADIPETLTDEWTDVLWRNEVVRIERIVSRGHTSPAESWYDQPENEWVAVLEGAGIIRFEDGTEHRLEKGDYLHIPAHARHQVLWTDPDGPTLWLAIFYR